MERPNLTPPDEGADKAAEASPTLSERTMEARSKAEGFREYFSGSIL